MKVYAPGPYAFMCLHDAPLDSVHERIKRLAHEPEARDEIRHILEVAPRPGVCVDPADHDILVGVQVAISGGAEREEYGCQEQLHI